MSNVHQGVWSEVKPYLVDVLLQQDIWRRVKPLAVDLAEDFCAFILLLFFASISVIIASYVIMVIRAITGETPQVLEYGIYLADASFLIIYLSHSLLLRRLKKHG
jgi:hypothetical protein